MFRETLTRPGGTSTGTASEPHVLILLRRATHRGYAIDVSPDGGAEITWTARRLGTGGRTITEPCSIRLVPELPAGKALTDATRRDLDLIDSTTRARYDEQQRVIDGGLWRIPQHATLRLRSRGLVVIEDDARVRLSLTARLALFARQHSTRTTEPAGWQRPADIGMASAGLNKPGRRAGLLYCAASIARCSCGFSRHCGHRDEARHYAAAHRQQAAGEFLAALLSTPKPDAA